MIVKMHTIIWVVHNPNAVTDFMKYQVLKEFAFIQFLSP